ncbi:DUF4844 domain-containing protein [Elizabethkingia ursingii]|uniref:DUF4844 domain-containing protein n=1 Tax=Elizabethkingia ursingii TaxID=1756150 RepID=UPI0020115104|nr:DUF4844 domain-containing protein [Elizabethkingia ursingii]MCL1668479.1 DUF4844 domain-containing protein [Elizabethkingia ursingii]
MKKIIYIFLILSFISCEKHKIKINNIMVNQLEEFKKKEKFLPDSKIFYPGIGKEKLKPIATKNINLAADDFEELIKTGNTSEEEFQNVIKKGLNRFSDIYIELDTEDRERVCGYFEELMDIIGLESSNGQLSNFMYDF